MYVAVGSTRDWLPLSVTSDQSLSSAQPGRQKELIQGTKSQTNDCNYIQTHSPLEKVFQAESMRRKAPARALPGSSSQVYMEEDRRVFKQRRYKVIPICSLGAPATLYRWVRGSKTRIGRP